MGRKTRDRTRQTRRHPTGKTPDPTLASVIDRYTGEFVKDIDRTKTQVLRAIKRYDIANQQCSTITSADIIAFATVFAIARPAWGYQLDQNARSWSPSDRP
jgi:hypothetical protein